jgi:hypothetical protein
VDNVVNLSQFKDNKKFDQDLTAWWAEHYDLMWSVGEPFSLIADAFPQHVCPGNKIVMEALLPEPVMDPEHQDRATFIMCSRIREMIVKRGYAELEDTAPEPFYTMAFIDQDIEIPAQTPWAYKAAEITLAAMNMVTDTHPPIGLFAMEVANQLDQCEWIVLEHNLKNQEGNGLILKVAKPGFGHATITYHYRRILQDWRDLEKATTPGEGDVELD